MTSPVFDAPPADRERLARAALSRLLEPGEKRIDTLMQGMTGLKLFQQLSDPDTDDPDLASATKDVAARLERLRPDLDLEIAAQHGCRFVIPGDDEWPEQLSRLAGKEPVQERAGVPIGLWVRGNLRLDALAASVAIVGSRDATSYGSEVTAQLAHQLATKGHVIVSGGAFGIDAAAHRGALASAVGKTVAVLACGIDKIYPEGNARLLQAVAERGAVISEVAPGLPVTRMRFLGRNRVIAGLACGTVVVEAAARSGALNTANWTTNINSPLMGVPGNVTEAVSVGVHELIRAGKAVLVTRAEDVLELVGRPGEYLVTVPRGPERRRDRLTAVHRQILDAVPVARPATAISIARSAGIHPGTVGSALATFEKHGLVERLDGGWLLTPEAVRS
ncbi:DNA-processing protein DprA [Nocardioides sp. DS6]|uniref:DNA-processing protein DprA n=1 Tax=Nocardioides eburneus TaxID=3231482 RepID=A0ABV3SU19_9ACTN